MTRRRRLSLWLLFVAFVAMPLLEIYVLIQVGQVIGAWPTVLVLVADSMAQLECELDRIVDGFGDGALIVGRVVAAHIDEPALRRNDRDDADLIHDAPLLAYLHPGRHASIDRSFSLPYPVGFSR